MNAKKKKRSTHQKLNQNLKTQTRTCKICKLQKTMYVYLHGYTLYYVLALKNIS